MQRWRFITIKTEEGGKKKLNSLIGFLSANKINNCNGEWRKRKKNLKESIEQVKK